MEWDQEAQEEAQRQASQVQRRDPDAAVLLLAQLAAEQRAEAARPQTPAQVVQGAAPPGGVYDPLDLYCRLARELHWSDRDMDEMDYVRFFGYVDRLARQQEREKEEMNTRNQGNGGNGLPPEIVEAETHALVAGLTQTPQAYRGEVVAYHGG